MREGTGTSNDNEDKNMELVTQRAVVTWIYTTIISDVTFSLVMEVSYI